MAAFPHLFVSVQEDRSQKLRQKWHLGEARKFGILDIQEETSIKPMLKQCRYG